MKESAAFSVLVCVSGWGVFVDWFPRLRGFPASLSSATMTSRLIVTSLADAAGSGLSSHGGSAQLTAKLARTTTRANGFTITTSIRRSGIALSSLAAAGRTRGSGRARTAGAFPSRLVYQPPRTSSSAITAGASSLFAFGRFGENRKMISQNNSQKPQLHQQFHTSTKLHGPVISLDTMNHNLRIMEYAVRGPIVIRAGEIERQLKEKVSLKTYTSFHWRLW